MVFSTTARVAWSATTGSRSQWRWSLTRCICSRRDSGCGCGPGYRSRFPWKHPSLDSCPARHSWCCLLCWCPVKSWFARLLAARVAVAGRADAAGAFRHDDAIIISERHVAVNLKCAIVKMLPISNSQRPIHPPTRLRMASPPQPQDHRCQCCPTGFSEHCICRRAAFASILCALCDGKADVATTSSLR